MILKDWHAHNYLHATKRMAGGGISALREMSPPTLTNAIQERSHILQVAEMQRTVFKFQYAPPKLIIKAMPEFKYIYMYPHERCNEHAMDNLGGARNQFTRY